MAAASLLDALPLRGPICEPARRLAADVRTTWNLLKPHARPHLGAFALTIVLGGISAMAQKSLWLLVPLVKTILYPSAEVGPAKQPGFFTPPQWLLDFVANAKAWILGDAASGGSAMPALWRVALVVACIAIGAGLAQYGFLTISRWLALRIVVDLRMRIARHLMGLSMSYHGRRHFGDLLSRISSDVTTTLSVLNLALKDLVQEPLLAFASLLYAAYLAPMPTLVVTAGMVLSLISGATMPEAALVGNLVASITVQQLATTGVARPEELTPRLEMWREQHPAR